VYVVDASVWVSRFVARDAFHTPSRLWIGALLAAQTIIAAPALVLPEVGGALARQTGRPDLALRALALLQRLPNVRFTFIEADLARSAAELAAELRLRGADAVYVALAKRLGVPLVTWDKEQGERAAARVETLSPAELLDRNQRSHRPT
jgi:predicted nucleic acid-binding protein